MGLKIIKAIKVKEEKDINKYKEFTDVDIILFDTPGMEKSLEFPKDLITKLPLGDKYALAGSISKDNVENISKLGINFFDLSSSLENQLGYKDHLKIRNFMNKFNEIKN
jgi:phosphoribosylanthranilate isomerase